MNKTFSAQKKQTATNALWHKTSYPTTKKYALKIVNLYLKIKNSNNNE